MNKTGVLTKEGKKLIGLFMFDKGKELIDAAILLKRQSNKSSFVNHYLLLQGLEIVIKGVLLVKNQEKYNTKNLKKISHNLTNLCNEIKEEFKIKKLNTEFETQLKSLISSNNWISYRYGGLRDIFIDQESLKTDMIYKKTYQMIKYFSTKYN